jgi:phosphoglycolate phosphatase
LLVGDTLHDVLGEKQAGVACAAVLYGYGTRAELIEAGATCLAETVEELTALLLQGETA